MRSSNVFFKINSNKVTIFVENQLNNQLEAAYAETALKCDEIESSLKRQLVDVSNQLRQSQNVIRNQQIEIKNLKIQITTNQDVCMNVFL